MNSFVFPFDGSIHNLMVVIFLVSHLHLRNGYHLQCLNFGCYFMCSATDIVELYGFSVYNFVLKTSKT